MSAASLPSAPWRRDAALIGLVGLAHAISHFSQLLLAPLFPWLKDAFGVSYAELGLLMTVFFSVSCAVQAAAGFWVDRYGPRPVLFAGLGCIVVAACGFAASTSYAMLASFSVVAGVGNGVFHPVDYTLFNRRLADARLGHAYSVHGVTGSLGWALAPALLVPLTMAYSWRVALLTAAALAALVLALLVWQRERLVLEAGAPRAAQRSAGARAAALSEGTFDFLRIPAVWMCFAFFFFYAGALSIVQTFGTQAARELHAVPASLAATCLTIYMVCAACGMVIGGFLAVDPTRAERIVGVAFGFAALLALTLALGEMPALAVPVIFGAMGVAAGIAGPSRDLLVKRSSPDNATGRVYGVVYAGLDIGQAVVPVFVGLLMDHRQFAGVWLALAAVQGVLIASAFNVRRARRTALAAA
ncbi:MAG: MFS transporter [Proteobacteria bacterium]|nr:MFS transporter [Pseudomonadota bacterium]